MTVVSTTSYIEVTADGVQTIFNFAFPYIEDEDISVFIEGAPVADTEYLLFADPTVGGYIQFNTAPAAGLLVLIMRETPYTQETDYPPYGPFPAESHEAALDKLTMMVQEVQGSFETILSVSFKDTGEWKPNTEYRMFNICIYAGNYYTCIEDFTSTDTFNEDNWTLVFDFGPLYDLAQQAAQSEANAAASAAAALESETNSKVSEQLAAASEANSAISENNAANCSAAALANADRAEAAADEAENTVSAGIRTDAITQDYFTAVAGQTVFNLSETPAAPEALIVFMNSRKLRVTEDYTISAQTIVLNEAAAAGDEIDVTNFNLSILVVP